MTSATDATTPTAATAGSTAAQAGQTAMQSLAGNFNDFLKLLMTQLQNQDPTSPMDTSQFTTQLVQFASVEQQINANTSLTQLIQLTQDGQMMQSSAMLGRIVQVASDQMPLQNGSGTVNFTATAAGPVEIGIYSASGARLRDVMLNAAAGTNSWTWNGQTDTGAQMPDGAYKVAVLSDAGATPQPLPFTVSGTVTDVTDTKGTPQLQIGALSVDLSAVRSVGK